MMSKISLSAIAPLFLEAWPRVSPKVHDILRVERMSSQLCRCSERWAFKLYKGDLVETMAVALMVWQNLSVHLIWGTQVPLCA